MLGCSTIVAPPCALLYREIRPYYDYYYYCWTFVRRKSCCLCRPFSSALLWSKKTPQKDAFIHWKQNITLPEPARADGSAGESEGRLHCSVCSLFAQIDPPSARRFDGEQRERGPALALPRSTGLVSYYYCCCDR